VAYDEKSAGGKQGWKPLLCSLHAWQAFYSVVHEMSVVRLNISVRTSYIFTYIHWLERLCRSTYSIPLVFVVIVIGPEADLGMFGRTGTPQKDNFFLFFRNMVTARNIEIMIGEYRKRFWVSMMTTVRVGPDSVG